jgi:hypothetical protein
MSKTNNTDLVSRIREIQKSEKANRKCANCFESGPIYVCVDYQTFICTECSGIHRELEHKVKSISMSNWTQAEIDALEFSGGNVRDRELFLATYKDGQFVKPLSSDRERLREFIKLKYITKKWAVTGAERSSPHKSESKSSRKKNQDSLSVSNDWADGGNLHSPTKPPGIAQSVVVHEIKLADVEAMFDEGINHLQRLSVTNESSARAIAERVKTKLEQSFLKIQSEDALGRSSNPFDNFTPTVVVGLPILRIPESPPQHYPDIALSSSGKIETAKPVPSSNPFDNFP